ncbi:MAG: histidinol dehydrogenase, partial [Eubacteriales bacterium]
HDELASAILVTNSEKLVKGVTKEVEILKNQLSRTEIMDKSLKNYGFVIIVDSIDEAIKVSDEIAPEHLEILTKEPFMVMTKIKNAGAIFLGEYSPEPLGDYMAGPNHVLPTNGTAKFFSPLGVDDFIKRSSIIAYSKEALYELHKDIISFAESEQLTAHANSIKVRFKND